MSEFVSGGPMPLSSVVEQHRQFLSPDRPAALRERIAKGLLPSSFDDLVPTLAFLLHDAEKTVREAAAETLSTAPEDELERVIKAATDIAVLDTLGRRIKAGVVPRFVALNRETHTETLVYLAGAGDKTVCDIVGRNAQRALRHPAMIEALFFNPKAPQGVVQHLLELAVRENLALDHMPGYREIRAALLGEHGAEEDDDGSALSDIEFISAMDMVLDFDADLVTGGDAHDEQEEVNRNLQAMVASMSVAQKIRLALVGDANARKLLIRDPKKMVSSAVLKSPRLTDGEVKKYAMNKSLGDDVIAQIARNKQWTRDYSVRKALVMNPKTPLSISMTFLRTLSQKDIKTVSKSREVTGAVARQAKSHLAKLDQAKRRKNKK
ncbi:MAG: hypothetical protein KC502_14325 [Myxococcales bacterium]|nr:hypothetical protein [Myxococcales bacterium]